MKKRIFITLQYLLPQTALSRLSGYAMESRRSWWKNWLIKCFIKTYQVDMSCAINSDPTSYPSFNAFFTRELKPVARPIASDIKQICSPADGTISQMGNIQQGRIIQAKGFDFSVSELLGGNILAAEQFNAGVFATIYLAPKDYHRVHMPMTGTLKQMIYIPGKLFSVNDTTAQYVPRVFARNERVVCLFETDVGPMAVILVGAFFVASIVTSWAGTVAPGDLDSIQVTNYQPGSVRLAKGAEVGYFKLGSTAIVLFPKNTVNWLPSLGTGSTVQMGQVMGELR
ncbi:MAG: archaetidylserine decarboxylase [Gammaproteobacteria bacterium]